MHPQTTQDTPPPVRLLDLVRVKYYSIRTEQAYVEWIKRYIHFQVKRHPRDLGAPEIAAYLTHLAVKRNVSASTQNQALAALLFLISRCRGSHCLGLMM